MATTTDFDRPSSSADARLAPAFELVGSGEVSVLSLDVFDTMLWRKVAEPRQAFDLIARRLHARDALAPGIDDAEWAVLRMSAEKRARELRRERGAGVEVTLEEVYAAMPESLLARPMTPAELAEVECEVERDLLVPDLDVLELIRAAHALGKQAIAVSDTYFSVRQLRLLLHRGPLAEERLDRIFTSSAHGTGKGEGLFSVVLEALGKRPEEIVHVGDNQAADILGPKRLGIQTVFFDRRPARLARVMEREAPYARAPLHDQHGENGLAALRGKVMGRVEGARQPAGLRAFWDYGAASLGPAFAAFAEWVHYRAELAEVSKAFCLMREGELLARLVNGAAPACRSSVVAEPLWLSRQVCARAAIVDGTRDELLELFVRRRLPTLREFATTLGLAVEDLGGLAVHADRWLDDAGLGDEAIDAVVFDPALRARVVAGAQELRRRIVRYVESVRPPGERRMLLVDLGWGATIQTLVQSLMEAAGVDCRTVGLYLVTGERATERALEGVECHGFLGGYGLPKHEVAAIMRSPEVLEQLCMPDHGSQIDLTEELQPVLAPVTEEFAFQGVQRAAVQQGILAFQGEWTRYRVAMSGALPPLWLAPRDRLRATIVRSVAAPTPDEAALFGAWLHDENFGSDRVEPIAGGVSAQALPWLDPRTLVEIPMTQLYWPFGLAALSDEHLAHATALASGGLIDWRAFASDLETGPFEVYSDLGWGFADAGKLELKVRRNRRGLSLARATVRGDFVQRIRLDPAKRPCLIRLDWIRLRCRVHGRNEPEVIELSDPADFAALKFNGCRLVAPKVLLAPGEDPWFAIDVQSRAGGRVYEVAVECAFGLLPLARSPALERRHRIRAALQRVAKESRFFGAPLRFARRVARRLAG